MLNLYYNTDRLCPCSLGFIWLVQLTVHSGVRMPSSGGKQPVQAFFFKLRWPDVSNILMIVFRNMIISKIWDCFKPVLPHYSKTVPLKCFHFKDPKLFQCENMLMFFVAVTSTK